MGIKQWTVGKSAPNGKCVHTGNTGAHFTARIQGLDLLLPPTGTSTVP